MGFDGSSNNLTAEQHLQILNLAVLLSTYNKLENIDNMQSFNLETDNTYSGNIHKYLKLIMFERDSNGSTYDFSEY